MEIRKVEEVAETNLGKGILFAFGGLVAGFALWIAVIWIINGGTGGAIGGALAAVLGSLIVGGYKKGKGPSGVMGIIVVVIFAVIGAVGVITLGAGIMIYQNGFAHTIFDGVERLFIDFGNRGPAGSAWLREVIIMSSITVGITVWTMMNNKKEKAEDLPDLEDLG